MKGALARVCLGAARSYVGAFPRGRGREWVMRLVKRRVLPRLPAGHRVMVRCADGRRFDVSVHDDGSFRLLMERQRDPRETRLVRALVRPGDVTFDLGANYGWYVTLLGMLVGPGGRVHAFEPVPPTFELLERNCRANALEGRVALNLCAVGEREGRVTIYVPRQHGGAALLPWGTAPMTEYECAVTTLDAYCAARGIDNIRLIKCDVEGAEMQVLRGSTRVLRSLNKPLWLLELNRRTCVRFGFAPRDLLTLLAGHGYVFHKLAWRPLGRPVPMASFDDFGEEENVVCSAPEIHGDVTAAVGVG